MTDDRRQTSDNRQITDDLGWMAICRTTTDDGRQTTNDRRQKTDNRQQTTDNR
jgi:hypothetical protein